MKQVLTYDEMSITMGGNFIDGACAVVGVARLLTPILAFSGVGLIIVKTAAAGCLIYTLTKLD
jgi:hypothetical protein